MLWLWENRGDLIIESSLNQYLFKMTYRRVLNHLTREQVKTKAEAAFYERTQAALCEVDYGRLRNWTGNKRGDGCSSRQLSGSLCDASL